MSIPFVHISNLTLQYPQNTVLKGLNWEILRGENWLLGGTSGSGKTSLARAIVGLENHLGTIQFYFDAESRFPKRALFVPSWYQFTNLEGDRNFYYQQRYNRHQTQDTLTVYAELLHYGQQEGLAFEEVESYLERFGFGDCRSNQLIELSSGEHKKLQLIKALWLKPQLLIIDQPYTGLDRASRRELNDVLDELSRQGIQLILISNDDELPNCINRFAEIEDGQIRTVADQFAMSKEAPRQKKALPYFLQRAPKRSADTLIQMENINVKYGDKQVLYDVNWTVQAGEKWLLQGPNGSGKSTLLSLINGDHPQAYTSELHLFGKNAERVKAFGK